MNDHGGTVCSSEKRVTEPGGSFRLDNISGVGGLGHHAARRPDAPSKVVGAPIRDHEPRSAWPREDAIRNEPDPHTVEALHFPIRRRGVESDLDPLSSQVANHGAYVALESSHAVERVSDTGKDSDFHFPSST
jgi:hypothetical protein